MAYKKTTREERLRHATRQRRDEDRAELRRAILDAAGALFLECGYEGFSLREVAERIGYSPGTIYLYFDDKDAILFAIADEGFQRFGEALRAASADALPARRLYMLGRAYVGFALANPAHYRLMFMERTDFTARKSEIGGQSWSDSYSILRQAVEAALAAGALRPGDAGSISDTIWAVLHGVVALGITMPDFDQARVENAIEMAFEMVGRGLFTLF